MSGHQDHTQGPILRAILSMGIPSMIGFAIGNVYDLVDMYWLSRLGPNPVAAVTILGPFLWVIHSANMIVGSGSVAIISRRYGERDALGTELAIRETLLLKWIVAISVGLLGFALTPMIARIMGAEGTALAQGIVYGRIIFLGLGFNFATYSIFTALRGVSNPNMAMILMISMTVLNLVLDPFLIFGWGPLPAMGVAGAAYASVISYAVAFTAGMMILCSGAAHMRLRLRSREAIRWGVMAKILKIGAPSAVGSISFSLARLVIMPMIAIFGMGVVAAYGVGTRVTAFGIMLLVGVGLGLSALVGQNIGAGKKERTRRIAHHAILLSVGIMTLLGLLVATGAVFIMRRFFDDPAIIAHGVLLLRVLALSFPFIGLYLMIENIYAGVGENRPAMTFNIIHAWVLEVPAVFICVKFLGLGPETVWWSITAASIISTLIFYVYFRRGGWIEVEV